MDTSKESLELNKFTVNAVIHATQDEDSENETAPLRGELLHSESPRINFTNSHERNTLIQPNFDEIVQIEDSHYVTKNNEKINTIVEEEKNDETSFYFYITQILHIFFGLKEKKDLRDLLLFLLSYWYTVTITVITFNNMHSLPLSQTIPIIILILFTEGLKIYFFYIRKVIIFNFMAFFKLIIAIIGNVFNINQNKFTSFDLICFFPIGVLIFSNFVLQYFLRFFRHKKEKVYFILLFSFLIASDILISDTITGMNWYFGLLFSSLVLLNISNGLITSKKLGIYYNIEYLFILLPFISKVLIHNPLIKTN